MKYLVVIPDGMADYPLKALGGKTPLQAAQKPTIEFLARQSELGLVHTIPAGMPPGSDTANLAVLGYNPATYYTGRSPFEAISMGLPLSETDVTLRCNLVTLSSPEPYREKMMLDHSADEITSEEARELMELVQQQLHGVDMNFYPGISYRHILIWNHGETAFRLTPPHDIIGKRITDHLPTGPYGEIFLHMMEKSHAFLEEHPVNQRRAARGLRKANSLWFWGEGKKPAISSFSEKYQLKGSVISAVDLIKGIGLCAGLKSIEVPGATGNLHTNYQGKIEAALEEFRQGQDFVYVHIEAPDECGHRGELENKVKAIELIDRLVLKPGFEGLRALGEDFKMMVLPDHPTPLSIQTHTAEPVPYLIYDSRQAANAVGYSYDERLAQASVPVFKEGYLLMDHFVGKK